MIITNKHNLPDYIYRIVSKVYPPKPNRLSVTDLINPRIQKQLKIDHWDELEEDASDRLWLFFGTMGHLAMEQGAEANSLSEEKLVISHNGITVVGKFDRLNADGELVDFKFTSVFSFIMGDHLDWERQLNTYSWMLRQVGFETKKLKVDAVLRDWSRNRMGGDYPVIPFQSVTVPLWTPKQQTDYIEDRIAVHKGDIVECSPEEKWAREDAWAVKKKGNKTARGGKVCKSKEEANQFIESNPEKKWEIEFRKGECLKCQSYCSVRSVCPFNKER